MKCPSVAWRMPGHSCGCAPGCAHARGHHLSCVSTTHAASGGRAANAALSLRLYDAVITLTAATGAAFSLIVAHWVPGALSAAAWWAGLAAGPLTLRALAWRFPRWPVLDVAATFWLLPVTVFGHAKLGPIIDAVNPELKDAQLARADLQLFGAHPSVLLGDVVPPWLNDVLFLCYYSYFLWPVLLGAALYARREWKALDEYVLALSLLFGANFLLYVLVPAVGPRIFLAASFAGPIEGVWLAPLLDSLMRQPAFMRDCFPSGHTAVTLLVLAYASGHRPAVFWTMLPFAAGLIAATLACRFHYAVDLLAALPLTLAALAAARALARARPRGVPIPVGVAQRLRRGAPARA